MILLGGGTTFFRKTVGNVTVPTWRTKVLVWLLPTLTIAAGLFWAFSSFMWLSNAVETTGTVTKIYQWEEDGAPTLYGPEFSYTWSDGQQTIGTLGLSSPDFNFEIGSEHTVLYDPAQKGMLRFPDFAFNYLGPLIIIAIGAMFALISLVLWLWVKAIARKRDEKEANT